MRILVVDDHDALRKSMVDALARQEDVALVDGAANGAEALKLLCQRSYDVMVTDIIMPVMDGYTLMQEMRKLMPSPSRLRRAGSPTAKPRPSSFSIRFFLRKNRRARPPAFGRRGVDKVRKYHFVCVVLSSAPLTLSPLYAPARPVFRNRPKEKAAAENRCGCEHAIYEL